MPETPTPQTRDEGTVDSCSAAARSLGSATVLEGWKPAEGCRDIAPSGQRMLRTDEELGASLAFRHFGVPPMPDFWLHESTPNRPAVHIAFRAKDRATVDAFYRAAIAAGGTDNGAPGVRPHYHANYYGAFGLDPDGHNIEACCHGPA